MLEADCPKTTPQVSLQNGFLTTLPGQPETFEVVPNHFVTAPRGLTNMVWDRHGSLAQTLWSGLGQPETFHVVPAEWSNNHFAGTHDLEQPLNISCGSSQ